MTQVKLSKVVWCSFLLSQLIGFVGCAGSVLKYELLTPRFNEDDRRNIAMEKLKNSDDATKQAILPDLVAALGDPDDQTRSNATEAIKAIIPNATMATAARVTTAELAPLAWAGMGPILSGWADDTLIARCESGKFPEVVPVLDKLMDQWIGNTAKSDKRIERVIACFTHLDTPETRAIVDRQTKHLKDFLAQQRREEGAFAASEERQEGKDREMRNELEEFNRLHFVLAACQWRDESTGDVISKWKCVGPNPSTKDCVCPKGYKKKYLRSEHSGLFSNCTEERVFLCVK